MPKETAMAIKSVDASPFKLRARQQTTVISLSPEGKIVTSDAYKKGDDVTDPEKVKAILNSANAHQFIKLNIGAA